MSKLLHLKIMNFITEITCVYSLKLWQMQGTPIPTSPTMSAVLLKQFYITCKVSHLYLAIFLTILPVQGSIQIPKGEYSHHSSHEKLSSYSYPLVSYNLSSCHSVVTI